MKSISPAGIALVQEFEGYHTRLPSGDCKAYLCPARVWTIGWGHTAGVKPGMVWTREQAEDALREDMATFEAAVSRLVKVGISQNQFDALVSFAYNCGEGALARSSILVFTNARQFDKAAGAFALWNRGGGKVLPGLVRRRAREAALYATPEPAENAEPDMPQAVDVPRERFVIPAADGPGESRALHAEAHDALKSTSRLYNANRGMIQTIVAGAAGAVAFLKEHALEVALLGLLAVVAFELWQLRQRNAVIREGQ